MPLYFFHVCDGAGFCEDPQGLELPNDRAAMQEAQRRAGALFGTRLSSDLVAAFVEVEDLSGKHLLTVTIDEVIPILPCGRRADRTRESTHLA